MPDVTQPRIRGSSPFSQRRLVHRDDLGAEEPSARGRFSANTAFAAKLSSFDGYAVPAGATAVELRAESVRLPWAGAWFSVAN